MLKRYDGFARGRPEFKAEVKHLQRMLSLLGYEVVADGYFGESTEQIIEQLQAEHKLAKTGQVDSATWQLIEQELSKRPAIPPTSAAVMTPDNTNQPDFAKRYLANFRGDLAWIHDREGHAGKAYWPGGASGVTLDPGFDLGQQELDDIIAHYQPLLSPPQLAACKGCQGLKGRKAKNHLNQSIELLNIRISKQQALQIFPAVIEPYWIALQKKFTNLTDTDTPASVQTALLSLAFNRGVYNKALTPLIELVACQQWLACADLISSMQQNHKLIGIRKRRRLEGTLIRASIDD